MIREYIEWDASGHLQRLLLLVKRFVKSRGIADASRGFLSSYAWVLLTLHVLLRQRLIPTMTLNATAKGFVLDCEGIDSGKLKGTPVSVLFFRVISYYCGDFDVMRSTATLRGAGEVSSLPACLPVSLSLLLHSAPLTALLLL
jgi:hypothetical protein